MNLFNPKILILYQFEFEAQKIYNFLKALGTQNIIISNNLTAGLKFAADGDIDLIICKLKFDRYVTPHKFSRISKIASIPTVFFTNSNTDFENFNIKALIAKNPLHSLILNPGQDMTLFKLITDLQNNIQKGPYSKSIILKSKIANQENVKIEDILFIEAQSSFLNIFTQYGIYTTTISLTKLLKKLSADFLRIHDKYAVNMNMITELKSTELKIDKYTLPIGMCDKYNKQKKFLVTKIAKNHRMNFPLDKPINTISK